MLKWTHRNSTSTSSCPLTCTTSQTVLSQPCSIQPKSTESEFSSSKSSSIVSKLRCSVSKSTSKSTPNILQSSSKPSPPLLESNVKYPKHIKIAPQSVNNILKQSPTCSPSSDLTSQSVVAKVCTNHDVSKPDAKYYAKPAEVKLNLKDSNECRAEKQVRATLFFASFLV